ncbi:MAG: hypothetical protein JXA10_11855 [Anaerolineae bacterium]|nr:hypothetical protein [Anaerolineae bacterium]
MINRRTSAASLAGLLLLVGLASTGCIQPIPVAEQTQNALATLYTHTPTFVAIPTNPPVQTNPQPTVASDPTTATIAQFIQSRNDAANNLVVWDQRPLGSDQVYGFSYTNLTGLPCAGFLLTGFVNGIWQPTNGAVVCAPQLGVPGIVGVMPFLASDGQPYTVTFGRVDNATVSAVALVYEDGSSDSVSVVNGGFMFVRVGITGATRITAIDALGNTVIADITQLPPA